MRAHAHLRLRGSCRLAVHGFLARALQDVPQARGLGVRLALHRHSGPRGLLSLVAGGQTAVSLVTGELVRDALPLALELAAARLSVLSPSNLLSHLGQRLKLLTGGPRDLPERQQTLRDTIAWSYDLLSDQEQAVFRALSLFSGSFTMEACEYLCQALELGAHEVIGLLRALVDKSLVAVVVQPTQESRFRLLKSIREFGLLELGGGQTREAFSARHAQFHLELAEAAWPELEGHDQKRRFEALDWEIENTRAACDHFAGRGEYA